MVITAIAIYLGAFSVMTNNKKIVVFLAAVGLVSLALLLPSSQLSRDVPEKLSSNTKPGLFANDPNFGSPLTEDGGGEGLLSRVIFAVLLVLAMGASAIYISKKLLPRISNLGGKKIRVIETVHLGPRKTLHLVKIGSQQLLIGSTNERITKLADVTEELEGLSSSETHIEETDE